MIDSLLNVQNMGYAYSEDNGKSFTLRDISFHLKAGQLLGILGPNGSGKSTLLRLLCRSLSYEQGTIQILDKPLSTFSQRELAREVALVPQEMSTVFPLTVEQMVSLGFYARSKWWGWHTGNVSDKLQTILGMTDLLALKNRMVSHLSGGERRRVLLARALAQEPKVLLLDEPLAHLDPHHQIELMEIIDQLRLEKEVAIVVVLHDLNVAVNWCPEVLLLKEGRLIGNGPSKEILTRDKIKNVYQVPAQFIFSEDRESSFIQFYKSK